MSVGTNENVTNVNEIDNVKNVENAVNTGGKVTQNTIDMQATQKIDFLDELLKESQKTAKKIIENQQGNFAPQNAQAENLSANENSNETVQQTPEEQSNEKINEEIIENTQEPKTEINNIENNAEENKNEEEQKQKIVQNVQVNIQENTAEKNQCIEQENVKKNKEKQHEQDKKDFRLERMLFARINTMQGKIKESLELIQKFERINAKEENLPNIVTTLHDKLTQEVIRQFRTVGIEFNMKSYLVQAVVSDMLGKFEEGITEFRNCSENLNFVREVQEDFESRVELAPTSRVKTFFARIRGIFKPERKQEKLEELERERQEKKLQEANIHLLKYKFINSELEKYTIKKNIVNSLAKEILHGQGSGLTLNVSEFIAEKIEPEMKKLGLEDSIPTLKEKMYEEYKLKDDKISQEDFEKFSVGELRKNMRIQKAESVRSKINMVVTSKSEKEEDDERLAI